MGECARPTFGDMSWVAKSVAGRVIANRRALVRRWAYRAAVVASVLAASMPASGAEQADSNGIRRRHSPPACPTTAIPPACANGSPIAVWSMAWSTPTTSCRTFAAAPRTGTIDQGKLQGILTVDFDKLTGGTAFPFFANFFQIHNTGRIRRDYVGGINTIAAIEAVPATRLSELWLEQKFGNNKASVRIGQLAADFEFFFSELSAMFLQSDWPTIAAANLPSGGPAYPLSTPGVRLKVEPPQRRVVLSRCSTAIRPGRVPARSSFATAMASTSASAIRPL